MHPALIHIRLHHPSAILRCDECTDCFYCNSRVEANGRWRHRPYSSTFHKYFFSFNGIILFFKAWFAETFIVIISNVDVHQVNVVLLTRWAADAIVTILCVWYVLRQISHEIVNSTWRWLMLGWWTKSFHRVDRFRCVLVVVYRHRSQSKYFMMRWCRRATTKRIKRFLTDKKAFALDGKTRCLLLLLVAFINCIEMPLMRLVNEKKNKINEPTDVIYFFVEPLIGVGRQQCGTVTTYVFLAFTILRRVFRLSLLFSPCDSALIFFVYVFHSFILDRQMNGVLFWFIENVI